MLMRAWPPVGRALAARAGSGALLGLALPAALLAQGAAAPPAFLQQYWWAIVLALLALLVAVFVVRRRKEMTADAIEATETRVKILLKNGRPQDAVKHLAELEATVGDLPIDLRLLYLQALYDANMDTMADEAYRRLDRGPLDLKKRYELGRCVEKAGRDGFAEEIYKEILKQDPDYADVKIRLDRVRPDSGSGGGAIGFGYDPSSISRHLAHRYLKMELIGKGGMGFVFKAFDQKRKRTVALKALSPFLAEEQEAMQRFMREAKILSQFEHPNVVKIFDVEEKPLVFYTMEFLKGRTLGHRLEEEGPLTLKELLDMAEALLLGLSHIHNHGVVHRDIKPENVLLDTDGTPRFTDFGLAVGDQATRITQAGQVMGTLRYMAPEQLRGEEVGPSADLFSLGVTLYEAASGIHAFSGEDRLHRKLTGRIDEVTDREIPQGLVALIELMMETNPEDRVQSAQDALELLRQLRRESMRRGPVTFLDETRMLRVRVVEPLAGFFAALAAEGEAARREFFEESSNVRDLKLLVWRLNEAIGRIQGAGKPPPGADPRSWARETGQLRNDLARFVRHTDMQAVDAFSLRIRRLEKQLDDFMKPFGLSLVETVFQPLEAEFRGRVMMRVPSANLPVFGVPDVTAVRAEIAAGLRDLIEAGTPVVQELAVRTKETAEGDRWLLQVTGEGIEKGHEVAAALFESMGAEVGFPEPGAFKVWLPFICEDRSSRQTDDPSSSGGGPSSAPARAGAGGDAR